MNDESLDEVTFITHHSSLITSLWLTRTTACPRTCRALTTWTRTASTATCAATPHPTTSRAPTRAATPSSSTSPGPRPSAPSAKKHSSPAPSKPSATTDKSVNREPSTVTSGRIRLHLSRLTVHGSRSCHYTLTFIHPSSTTTS